MAAALVIVALAGGWLLVAPPLVVRPSTAATRRARALFTRPPTTEAASSLVPPTLVARRRTRETRHVRPVNAIEAYEAAAGVRVVARGPPACARARRRAPGAAGGADDHAVGRYRCIFTAVAAMWWTDRGLVAHAVAEHADLARLFMWCAHLEQ